MKVYIQGPYNVMKENWFSFAHAMYRALDDLLHTPLKEPVPHQYSQCFDHR